MEFLNHVRWIRRFIQLTNSVSIGTTIFVSIFASDLTLHVLTATVIQVALTRRILTELRGIGVKPQELPQLNEPEGDVAAPLRLLMKILPSAEEQHCVIGDLVEESARFQSRTKANIWLYKQVLKSAPLLIYKNVRSRLASYFSERAR